MTGAQYLWIICGLLVLVACAMLIRGACHMWYIARICTSEFWRNTYNRRGDRLVWLAVGVFALFITGAYWLA